MGVSTIIEHVGVVSWAVSCVRLHEYAELGLQGFQTQAARGVITTIGLDHVMREEALHVVKHPCGSQVELLHMRWGQEGGLTIWAEKKKKRERMR